MALLVILALIGSACSGEGTGGSIPSGETSSKVELSGTISATAGKPGAAKVSNAVGSVSEVWAVPIAKMQGANIDSVNLMLRKTTTIDGSGSFSFELEKTITLAEILERVPTLDTNGMSPDEVFDVDWLLIQMSGTSPLNVVELKGDATYDGMLTIPLSDFSAGSINLGAISSTDGVAALSVSGIADDVTLSAGDLASIARSDDILGTVTDIIRNCDLSVNKCLKAQQSFVFTGDYSMLTDRINYSIADSYSGYQFYFDVTDYFDKTDFDGICPVSGPVAVEYQLAPPDLITISSVTYGPSNPLSTGATLTGSRSDINDGAYTECFKNQEPLYLRKDNNSADWNLQFITGDDPAQLTTATPAGDWVLSRKGNGESSFTEIGRFEFALAKPIDDSGKPIVYVPALRFKTDAYNGLTTLYIKWYQYIGTGYEEVTDGSLLDSLMGGFEVSMDDNSGIASDPSRRSVHQNNISFSTTSMDVSNLDGKGMFYYNDPMNTTKYNLDYIGISYQYGGQSFRFAWTVW